MTAKVGDPRTKISTVAGTSSDLATIPVVGESVKTKPTVTLTSGSPARFSISSTNGEWQKKVNGQKLGGKPSKPGLYIKGGKKVLMK